MSEPPITDRGANKKLIPVKGAAVVSLDPVLCVADNLNGALDLRPESCRRINYSALGVVGKHPPLSRAWCIN